MFSPSEPIGEFTSSNCVSASLHRKLFQQRRKITKMAAVSAVSMQDSSPARELGIQTGSTLAVGDRIKVEEGTGKCYS